jgi:general secretion pathway protein L
VIRAFLAWWKAQLLDLLPARLRPRPDGLAEALVVTLRSGDGVPEADFQRRRKHRETSLGSFPVDSRGIAAALALLPRRPPPPVILRLPAFMVLERDVVLPLAAERAPRQVLTYDMDRLTPFTADEVYWSWRIDRRDAANGRLHLRVTLTAKAAVRDVIEVMTAAGAAPAVLEGWPPPPATPPAVAQPRRIPLRETAAFRPSRLAQVLLALCAVLAVAVVATPLLMRALAVSRMEARIDALKPAVAEAEALRRRITSAAGETDVLTAERARVGDALQALAAVTDSLPDDTYLTGFALHDRQLVLEGQSAAAARLIPALAANPLLHNPAFAAPVTRSESGRDVFSIHAELAH